MMAGQPTPPKVPPAPRNKVLLRGYYPLVSFNKALISWGVNFGGGQLKFPWFTLPETNIEPKNDGFQ